MKALILIIIAVSLTGCATCPKSDYIQGQEQRTKDAYSLAKVMELTTILEHRLECQEQQKKVVVEGQELNKLTCLIAGHRWVIRSLTDIKCGRCKITIGELSHCEQ